MGAILLKGAQQAQLRSSPNPGRAKVKEKQMNTSNKLQELESIQFISKAQAVELSSIAFKEFSKRSAAAKNVDAAIWDMALAGGCPNAVRSAVVALVARYANK